MWIKRSEVLSPLTSMTSKEAKWNWTNECQMAFDIIKKIVSREVLLSYPDFSDTFEIHTDASKYQLGAVISQKGRPIAFYSRKLNSAQVNYTTTERELLSIVETLKEFRNILLGQKIRVYTDHKNLTYKSFNTERVMRWRLILEEFGPELHYIKGQKNIVADTLSRLDLTVNENSDNFDEPTKIFEQMAVTYAPENDDFPKEEHPISYKTIMAAQLKDKHLLKCSKTGDKNYSVKTFQGADKVRKLICYKDKIVIPKSLQKRVVLWYHNHLQHPGETRTELCVKQHFYWKNLRETVHNVVSKCHICQLTKKNKKKYGKLPEKIAESVPWDTLCIDLIGPYKFKSKRKGSNKKQLELHALTMIDPATGWMEMVEIPNKRADTIANLVEQTWLMRYPWPTKVITDRGSEFMAEVKDMIEKDYNIKLKKITTRNPQANAVLERAHQTIGNILRTYDLSATSLSEVEAWNGILASTMFAMRATVHTTTQYTPAQLVFGRDSVLNITHDANWKIIKERKQKLIQKGNQRENRTRLEHQYKPGDKVLIKNAQDTKFGQTAYAGPYIIQKVNNNGTVRAIKQGVSDTYNIRNVQPYQEDLS